MRNIALIRDGSPIKLFKVFSSMAKYIDEVLKLQYGDEEIKRYDVKTLDKLETLYWALLLWKNPFYFEHKIIYGCEGRGDGDKPYLTRYTLLKRKTFQICLHIFHRSDADDMHDHPWDFLSIILWRGYVEQTPEGKKRKWPGMFLYRKAEHQHRVELVNGKRAITLMIMGTKRRDWEFFTKLGRIPWMTYFYNNRC